MVTVMAAGFGPSLLFIFELLAAGMVLLTVVAAFAVLLHWVVLRLVAALPDPERPVKGAKK